MREVSERLGIPPKLAEENLTALEAQPTVTRELLMQGIVETRRVRQREAYQPREGLEL